MQQYLEERIRLEKQRVRQKQWRDTAIRGHRKRGSGILNNEQYNGRLLWNRTSSPKAELQPTMIRPCGR